MVPAVIGPVLTSSMVPETLKLPSAAVVPNVEALPQLLDPISALPLLSRIRMPTPDRPVLYTSVVPDTGYCEDGHATTGLFAREVAEHFL
jgi:hypothetical protein